MKGSDPAAIVQVQVLDELAQPIAHGRGVPGEIAGHTGRFGPGPDAEEQAEVRTTTGRGTGGQQATDDIEWQAVAGAGQNSRVDSHLLEHGRGLCTKLIQ
jgi:hypothetical protein